MPDISIQPITFDSDSNILDLLQDPGSATTPQEEIKKESSKPTEEKTTTTQPEKEKGIVETQIPDNQETEEDDSPNLFDILNTKKQEEAKTKPEAPQSVEEAANFNELAKYLIDKGAWEDFEDSDKMELNAESFAALSEAQAEQKAQAKLIEKTESLGSTANELIDFLKNKGNLDDFVANLETQKDIESISIDDADGQEKVIKEYYSAIGWNKERINKHITRLKDEGEGELRGEAENCKTDLVAEINEQRKALVKEQEAIAQDRKLKTEKFNTDLRKEIHSDKDLADREKKEFEKFFFDIKYEDPTSGQKYSEFGKELIDIQKDPKKYYKFLRFVKDFDNFEQKAKVVKEEAKKTYNFLRGSASDSLAGVASQEPIKTNKGTEKIPAFKFK